MLAVTCTGTIRSSVTANMNLIDERFFWYRYRYRVQCDRGFLEIICTFVLLYLTEVMEI